MLVHGMLNVSLASGGTSLKESSIRGITFISRRCNATPPIQETSISGKLREKETISRYHISKMYAKSPRDMDFVPSANGVRLTTRSLQFILDLYSRKSVISFRSYAYNRIEFCIINRGIATASRVLH